jgi:hypothetical protein
MEPVSMLPLLMLAWPLSVGLLWLSLYVELREPGLRVRRSIEAAAYLLFGLPPTSLMLPFVLLLFASPVAQFNAGSDLGMSLWSFWTSAWEPVWYVSGLSCLAYLVAVVVLAFRAEIRYLMRPAVLAFVSCGIAWSILRFAFPTA